MCPTKFTSRFFRRNREVERGYIFDSPANDVFVRTNKQVVENIILKRMVFFLLGSNCLTEFHVMPIVKLHFKL